MVPGRDQESTEHRPGNGWTNGNFHGQGLDYKIMGRFFSGLAQASCEEFLMRKKGDVLKGLNPNLQRDQQQFLDMI